MAQPSQNLARLRTIVLIKTECRRLEYRIPSDKVLQTWSHGYARHVLNCLKHVGDIEAGSGIKGRWPEYNARA